MTISQFVRKWSNILSDNPRNVYSSLKGKFQRKINNNQVIGHYTSSKPVCGRVLISYIVEPFVIDSDSSRFYTHQNKWQALEIAKIFNNLGYITDIYRFDDLSVGPDDYSQYNILFGMGPNFQRFSNMVDDDVYRIYYATGMHSNQRNPAEKRRVERFNRRNDTEFSTSRQLHTFDLNSTSDAIIVVGDEYSVETYRNVVSEKPIYRIRLSSWDSLENCLIKKNYSIARKNFLYFGGGGFILKGLDLLIEVFSELKNLNLYICGPLANNNKFTDVYESELQQDNINAVGFTQVNSEQFRNVTEKCGFVILPSASEAGLSGGVVTCMHRGLIPVVSRACVRNTEDWGITLADCNKDTIRTTIQSSANMKPSDCRNLAQRAHEYANTHHTKETFSSDFNNALAKLIKDNNQ